MKRIDWGQVAGCSGAIVFSLGIWACAIILALQWWQNR